jgi:hypothetical protein
MRFELIIGDDALAISNFANVSAIDRLALAVPAPLGRQQSPCPSVSDHREKRFRLRHPRLNTCSSIQRMR